MAELLRIEGVFTPASTKTQLRLPFEVGEDIDTLELAFSYDPVELRDEERSRILIEEGLAAYGGSRRAVPSDEPPNALPAADLRPGKPDWRRHLPLRNLVTLSLDGPSGFRGCAHRRPNGRPIALDPVRATPGFAPGPVEPGTWVVTLSVYLIVTGLCSYRLEARGLP